VTGAWTNDELRAIDAEDELPIATRRQDGTLRRPVIVWVVRQDDEVYIRSVGGRTASWFRGAQTTHDAHVEIDELAQDVTLVETDDRGDAIDAAYREKYGRHAGIVDHVLTPEARAATLKLVPRSAGA
jgi:hypothetical protein